MKQSLLSLLMVFAIVVVANAQDSTAKKDYVGKYKFPEGSVVPDVDVTIDGGALMMTSTAGTSTLELIKGDTFTIVAFNGIAVFKRNDAKKVVGVHIDAGGYVLDGVKDGVAFTFTMTKIETGLQNTANANKTSIVTDIYTSKRELAYSRKYKDVRLSEELLY